MQVAGIKPTLKAPGTKRLKPTCDELLSNSAFIFNLRCYNAVKRELERVELYRAKAGAYTRPLLSSS